MSCTMAGFCHNVNDAIFFHYLLEVYMCGKFLVANSYGLLYRGLDRGHVKFLELRKKPPSYQFYGSYSY